MVYLTETFDPQVALRQKFSNAVKEWAFYYNNEEIAYICFSPNYDPIHNQYQLHLSRICVNSLGRHHFKKEHIGTELFNAALLDMYHTWNVDISSIKGSLSCSDGRNKAWRTSIPFYRDFPQYLKLPYTVTFQLFEDSEHETEIYVPEYGNEFVKALEQKYIIQDLYFHYIFHKL